MRGAMGAKHTAGAKPVYGLMCHQLRCMAGPLCLNSMVYGGNAIYAGLSGPCGSSLTYIGCVAYNGTRPQQCAFQAAQAVQAARMAEGMVEPFKGL